MYFISDIQDYFKYIIQKHEIITENLPKTIDVNETENRITFKIKTRYYLELLTSKTMKFFGNSKSKITKSKNDKK